MIESVHLLLAEIMQAMEGSTSLVLDFEGVTSCSIATLQLLCSAGLTADSCGRTVELRSVHSDLAATLHSMGFAQASPFARSTQQAHKNSLSALGTRHAI